MAAVKRSVERKKRSNLFLALKYEVIKIAEKEK